MSKIAKILVRGVDSKGNVEEKCIENKKKVACETFWKDAPCVIVFFRRFGCQFCRLFAKDYSENLKPILDRHNIRLIGIGFDSEHVKPFVQEGFFKGELYLDNDLETYKALNMNKYSWWQIARTLVSTKALKTLQQIATRGIKGNLTEGDGFQSGGVLVVATNGKHLLEYRQKDVTDMASTEEILKALNIKKD